MDMPRSEVRKLRFDEYSATKHLEHATRQAHERNYQDFLIVDVDSHHYEDESYKDVFSYIDNPVIRRGVVRLGRTRGVLLATLVQRRRSECDLGVAVLHTQSAVCLGRRANGS